MSKVVELPQTSFSRKLRKSAPPRKPRNAEVRSREYLTAKEVERLMAAARKVELLQLLARDGSESRRQVLGERVPSGPPG